MKNQTNIMTTRKSIQTTTSNFGSHFTYLSVPKSERNTNTITISCVFVYKIWSKFYFITYLPHHTLYTLILWTYHFTFTDITGLQCAQYCKAYAIMRSNHIFCKDIVRSNVFTFTDVTCLQWQKYCAAGAILSRILNNMML